MFILNSASISALNTVIATTDTSWAERLGALFLSVGRSLLLYGWMYVIMVLLHDVIIKWIYCIRKKKRNNKKKCYFWNCNHWHECPYNGAKKKEN